MVSRKGSQAGNELSLWFYQYCCRVIGDRKVVRTKRQICSAIQHVMNLDKRFITSISGSTAEGLGLKGSDYDTMLIINTLFHVYENESDINTKSKLIPLTMMTDGIKTGYTRIKLMDQSRSKECRHYLISIGEEEFFSSKKFLEHYLTPNYITHGPCRSDPGGLFDSAICLKCDKWIACAQPWIRRSRTSWPPVNLVNSIVNYGIQLAPVGCKGSATSNIEWRLSFAVAEKHLIFSLLHNQILCYGLLKILLKDVKELGYMDRLCSYFLKTIILWLSEEVEQSKWEKENFIRCFMACLQRLIYCVKYEACVHYFIPDNNMFEGRFRDCDKKTLFSTLTNIYNIGWEYFFQKETFGEFSNNLVCSRSSMIYPKTCLSVSPLQYMTYISVLHYYKFNPEQVIKCITNAVNGTLHLPGRQIFIVLLSIMNQRRAQETHLLKDYLEENNKSVYRQHKLRMHYLLQGTNHDAVSGWSLLASYFYFIKQYDNCMNVIKICLLKCTVDKIHVPSFPKIISESIFQNHTNCNKRYRFLTACRECTIWPTILQKRSRFLLTELKPWIDEYPAIIFPTPVFLNFLYFLCLHQRGDLSRRTLAYCELKAVVLANHTEFPNCLQTNNAKILFRKAEIMLKYSRQYIESQTLFFSLLYKLLSNSITFV
ncbi:uncharacterized protein [Mytilus edulis]|uniref:uncharacterized protein n=1 Tax=Mytilus edulis TaxID=6550 RepID=UPI0039F112A7